MPNHVSTRCIVTGPADKLLAFKITLFVQEQGEPSFDFNMVVPMPEIIKGTESGSDADLGMAILSNNLAEITRHISYPWAQKLGIKTAEDLKAWAEKERPSVLEKGRQSLQAKQETGFTDWYGWSVRNWGTKWNSYSLSIESDEPERLEFSFDTAWNFPTPVFEALAQAYPDLVFECVCFDEGWNFAGRGQFNGDDDFETCEATDELYEAVYGAPPEREEEDEEDSEDEDSSQDETSYDADRAAPENQKVP